MNILLNKLRYNNNLLQVGMTKDWGKGSKETSMIGF